MINRIEHQLIAASLIALLIIALCYRLFIFDPLTNHLHLHRQVERVESLIKKRQHRMQRIRFIRRTLNRSTAVNSSAALQQLIRHAKSMHLTDIKMKPNEDGIIINLKGNGTQILNWLIQWKQLSTVYEVASLKLQAMSAMRVALELHAKAITS